MALVLVISFLFIRPESNAWTANRPRRLWARFVAKVLFVVLPGAFDVRRRSSFRGVVLLLLTGFVLMLAISQVKTGPVYISPGISTATALPNLEEVSPFPPEISAVDMMFAPPHALWFWGFAVVAVAGLLIGHLLRLPAILALYRDVGPDEAPTAVKGDRLPGEAL